MPPLLTALAALAFRPIWFQAAPDGAINRSNALLVWIVLVVLFVVPPVAAVALGIVMKSDWGIPLYFLAPVAALALPFLAIPRAALWRAGLIVVGFTLVMLLVAPFYTEIRLAFGGDKAATDQLRSRSRLAQTLTELWHRRYDRPLPAVIGSGELAPLISFYSPDHPIMMTIEWWRPSGVSFEAMKRTGFIGVCDARKRGCLRRMEKYVTGITPLTIDVPRDPKRAPGSTVAFMVFVAPPVD